MKSQPEIIALLEKSGVVKTSYPIGHFTLRAVLAGAFIALGAILSIVASTSFSANPSLQKVMSGLTFPIGLVLTVVFGAELFTGNCAALFPALADKRIAAGAVASNWFKAWLGNFLGALIVVGLCVVGGSTLSTEPFSSAVIKIADTKIALDPLTAFWRGIACNWLVCLGVWLSMTSDSLGGKVIGCWLPVAAFVILGFEHCIANMFFIPAGMYQSGVLDIAGLFHNLVPVTLGNIVGGALFVGIPYTWLFRQK